MNILDLYQGAILSIESHQGRKKVWIHIGNQRFPLTNQADLEEGMAQENPSWQIDACASLRGDAKGVHNN